MSYIAAVKQNNLWKLVTDPVHLLGAEDEDVLYVSNAEELVLELRKDEEDLPDGISHIVPHHNYVYQYVTPHFTKQRVTVEEFVTVLDSYHGKVISNHGQNIPQEIRRNLEKIGNHLVWGNQYISSDRQCSWSKNLSLIRKIKRKENAKIKRRIDSGKIPVPLVWAILSHMKNAIADYLDANKVSYLRTMPRNDMMERILTMDKILKKLKQPWRRRKPDVVYYGSDTRHLGTDEILQKLKGFIPSLIVSETEILKNFGLWLRTEVRRRKIEYVGG